MTARSREDELREVPLLEGEQGKVAARGSGNCYGGTRLLRH
jgi:hypothetical protein